jgi:hypothetical protein
MKIENANIWLTKEFEPGKSLAETRLLDVYENIQATIYYESGLQEIDHYFKDKDYINSGYVCSIISFENGISIIFSKYKRNQISDMGICHIDRSKIIRFEEFPASDLLVVKREETKHKAKYMGKQAFGLLSSVTKLVADEMVSVNTQKMNGSKYKLLFMDKNEVERSIIFYSSDEFMHESSLFLNSYFKPVLSSEALDTSERTNSNCFIATACYKDIYCEEVIFFRWYRDNVLLKSVLGRMFIKAYYFISPYFFKAIYNSDKYSKVVKMMLDKLFILLKSKS